MATFMSLPRELRDQIYADALIIDCVIVHNTATRHYCLDWTRPEPKFSPISQRVALGLLAVNKAVAAEAASTFFSQNVFKFPIPRTEPEDLSTTVFRKNAHLFQYLLVRFDMTDYPEYATSPELLHEDFDPGADCALNKIVQALCDRVDWLPLMTNLRFVDISSSSLITVARPLLGPAASYVKLVAECFAPVLKQIVQRLHTTEDKPILCRVRVVETGSASYYEPVVKEAWQSLDVEFVKQGKILE